MATLPAKARNTAVSVKLWESGIRSLFKFYIFRTGLSQYEVWASCKRRAHNTRTGSI